MGVVSDDFRLPGFLLDEITTACCDSLRNAGSSFLRGCLPLASCDRLVFGDASCFLAVLDSLAIVGPVGPLGEVPAHAFGLGRPIVWRFRWNRLLPTLTLTFVWVPSSFT